MSSIYIKEQGAMVRKQGERLLITKQGQTLDQFPLGQVQQLVLMGNVQVSTHVYDILKGSHKARRTAE